MKTYRQTFENLFPKSREKQFSHYIFAGIVYLVLGIAYYFRNSQDILMITILFVGGLGYIVIAFYRKHRKEKYFIEFNSIGIDAYFSVFKSLNIKWNQIKEIEIKPLSIVIKLESDITEEVLLSVWSYGSVINIKAKLKEFADEKGIICH